MPDTRSCPSCPRPMVFLACKYPFWYHEGGTPRHGDWVPEHNCVADASRARADDPVVECEA